MDRQGYFFTSSLFAVVPGEDAATNPGCYGKQVAEWVATQLKARGYEEAEVIPEDWGWCVMCGGKDFLVWVGCGNVESDSPDIVWHVFPVVEVPFFSLKSHLKRLLGGLDTRSPLLKLDEELHAILAAEPAIQLEEAP